ncbi:MAG: pyrroloquinoline quinone biosynthesis peptide chaperone PqqD [Pseudomonadota bacterium]
MSAAAALKATAPPEAPRPAIAAEAVPYLPRGVRLRHCDIRKSWFLLAPERAMKLDPVGAHVLQALDGQRSLDGVVDHLVAQFQAPRAQIATDATAFLVQMHERGMVALK